MVVEQISHALQCAAWLSPTTTTTNNRSTTTTESFQGSSSTNHPPPAATVIPLYFYSDSSELVETVVKNAAAVAGTREGGGGGTTTTTTIDGGDVESPAVVADPQQYQVAMDGLRTTIQQYPGPIGGRAGVPVAHIADALLSSAATGGGGTGTAVQDAYASAFVDLYVASRARCVSVGVGNFALLAIKIGAVQCHDTHATHVHDSLAAS